MVLILNPNILRCKIMGCQIKENCLFSDGKEIYSAAQKYMIFDDLKRSTFSMEKFSKIFVLLYGHQKVEYFLHLFYFIPGAINLMMLPAVSWLMVETRDNNNLKNLKRIRKPVMYSDMEKTNYFHMRKVEYLKLPRKYRISICKTCVKECKL